MIDINKNIGLSTQQLNLLNQIFSHYLEIYQVRIYGSRAKGNYQPHSDIDLAIYGKNLDRFIVARLLMELEDSDIPYQIDLQDYATIQNQELRSHIDRVGITIYSTLDR